MEYDQTVYLGSRKNSSVNGGKRSQQKGDKMKRAKVVVIVVGIMAAAGMLYGDALGDYAAASKLHTAKKYEDAQKVWEKMIADYPDAPVNLLASARMCVGNCLKMQKGKQTEAQEAFRKAIRDYPSASVDMLVNLERLAAHQYTMQGKFAEAQAEYVRILRDYPGASVTYKAKINRSLGIVLQRQGKYAEAQAVFAQALKDHQAAVPAEISGLLFGSYEALHKLGQHSAANTVLADLIVHEASRRKIEGAALLASFDLVVPTAMTADDYTALLRKILVAVPATEANAEFLGKVKSEYEKMN
jgi:TolA-binding protein